MAEKIGVWSISGSGKLVAAEPLEELRNTETEQRLEELLVTSPDVLMPELTLIGRQIPTSGGPLDLLGVDQDGRLVLFELKRGTLTRDAVAQILDYGSDLQARDPVDFAKLVQSNSGKYGIEKIEDFSDWYRSEFPDVDEPPPVGIRLVLVGLGADDRARRMVTFLADAGTDIQLLTFQAFKKGTEIFLARHVETVERSKHQVSAAGGTKAGNRQILEQLAANHGVRDLLIEVADFVEPKILGYRWPGKTAFTFSLQETNDQGRPALRAYALLAVDQSTKGRLLFSLVPRAVEAAPAAVDTTLGLVPSSRRTQKKWTPFELTITEESWPSLKSQLGDLLSAVVNGWREKRRQQEAEAVGGDPTT